MRIAFNPSTVEALIAPPNNKDITFDLRGHNIFARGVKFCGTDTNTWRDIKINNVSIGSNTLNLRDGNNTTLTNTNGIVTINSTWRPVVDNLTSDSTTSSLSAKQGKVLKALIDGKSDSDHNHDDRYLRLTGGWMSGDIAFGGDNKIYWGRNTDSASISFKNDGDGDADSYMSFVTSDNGNEYFRWSHSSGSTNTEWMSLRSDGLRVGGTKVSLEGHSHNDLYYTKTEVNNKLNSKSDTSHTHDDRYLKLTGGTMQLGEGLKFHADENYFGTDSDARIISLLDGNDVICDGGLIIDERATYNGTEYVTELLRIRDSEFKWKGSNILHSGNTYVSNNKGYINGTEITQVNNSDTVDGYHASSLVKFYLSPITSNAPADSAKNWFINTMPSASGAIVYNVPGSEKTIIAGKSSGAHGHMLQLNYDDNYLRMLRYVSGSWKSTDWEKISAGYADSSGNTDLLDGYHASDLFTNLSNSGNNISITIGGTNKTLTVGYASTATQVSKSLKWTDATGTAQSYNGSTEKSITSLNFPYNQIALNFRHPGNEYATKIQYMTAGNEALVFAAQNSVTSFIFKSGANITNSSLWYDQVPTPTLQLKGQSAYINKLIANGSVPAFNFLVNGSSRFDGKLWQLYSTRTDPNDTCIRDSAIACFGEYDDDAMWIGNNTNNGTWIQVSFRGDEDRPSKNYLYNLSLQPLGGNVGIGTNSPTEKLTVNGWIGTNGIYTNRTGSSTDGGVSLYSNVDPMTYGIAFRGTGTYGTHGYVTSTSDWATYLTMNDSTTRGWIFRRGDTNVASIAGSGNMAIGQHLEFSNGAHISTNRSTDYHYGYTFNLGDNTKSIGMYSGPGGEAGGVVISPDGCLIYNSSDCGYNLQVRDKDLGSDLTNIDTLTFGIEQSGYYAWSRGGFKKNGSSDSYVLLGGGGHKVLSDFAFSSHSHNYAANENYGGFTKSGRLPISGFYQSTESESGGNAPWTSWMHLINCQHSTTSNNYALQIAASFFDNNTFKIRVTNDNVNNDWRDIIHSGNIGSQTVANAYHLRINSANTWSTWYWAGQGGQPSWLWGSNDGTNMYVWDPNNFNVHTAQYLRSLGNQNCQTGRTQNYGDVYSYNTITGNTGSPTEYSSVIGFGRGIAGTVEIAGGWCNTHLYWRSLRDCCEDWYSWRAVLDSSNYTEFINNYYWANVKISTSSSTTTSPTVSNLTATSSIRMGNILLEHTDEINSASGLHLNYRNSSNVSLCIGGGNVGISHSSPSYKLDVNGQMRASGFHHGSVNSDNYILLAGGGYTSFGGDSSHPIFLGYLNLEHGNDGTISSSFYCLGYSVSFTYTRGGNYCKIYIPDTSYQTFYIRAATASVNYSGGGMDTWTGYRKGEGAWWLHCYAYSSNEVRVKGFRQANDNNDSWWGGNPLYSGNGGANRITVCIFGCVTFR